jgi:hypothetical protein
MSFGIDFSWMLEFTQMKYLRDDDEISEGRSNVVWSPKNEEEKYRFWSPDDDKVLVYRIKTFDSICCSPLHGLLLDERKKDSKVLRF